MCPGSGGGGNKRSRQENGDDAGVKEEDVSDLRAFLKEEEAEIRAESRTLLNRELIARIESCKSLCDKANEHQSFPEALSSGLVAAVRQELSSCFRLGVRLESFINTYQPPLASGGNVGVSAEVQEGIYQNVRAMTTESGSALHRMLAYEKEHATMRTKCIDEAVWERYKANLASLMQVSHDRVCPHVTRHSFLMF
tara:strand:- start:394 stop:981 length:588 start_codon:yes stop_codon:yes gene_type:complete